MRLPSRDQVIEYAEKAFLIFVATLLLAAVLALAIGAAIWNAYYGQPVVLGGS